MFFRYILSSMGATVMMSMAYLTLDITIYQLVGGWILITGVYVCVDIMEHS